MRNVSSIFKILVQIWILIILPFTWITFQVIEQLPRKGLPQSLYDITLGFIFLPGWPITLTCSAFGLLLFATIITRIIMIFTKKEEAPISASTGSITLNTIRNNQGVASSINSTGSAVIIQNSPGAIIHSPSLQSDDKQEKEQKQVLLHRYFRMIISRYKDLNPTGIDQSFALLSVNVPLDDIFIHIRAVSDRPVFDVGIESQKLQKEIEQIRHHPNLDEGERESYIQALRAAKWHSQLGEGAFAVHPESVKIEDVLQNLTSTRSAAIILGAPGSGKSTIIRWLALHMARASCDSNYSLPEKLAPVLLPIILTISDYAKAIAPMPFVDQRITSLKEFLWNEWTRVSSELPVLIENELLKGHCLLLFDGLDEVTSDALRERIYKDLFEFISLYSPEQDNAPEYNRALITSRIVGYEPGQFASFAQYTLCDLNDQQIRLFLNSWCLAVERYQERARQGMRGELTPQQEQHVQQEGYEQRDLLLEALNRNPSIRRLAVNPFMLTILALIQKSGRQLPHHRFELYQTITRTMLDSWNQSKGGAIFSQGKIDIAEEVLSKFAYQLHKDGLPLTEKAVLIITRETMADYDHYTPEYIQNSSATEFFDTLRRSSGLFVERGQGLYGFIHRTFQEYYAMCYLVNKQHYPLIDKCFTPGKDLEAFVAQKCHIPSWHEPLLLLIAYKSGQKEHDEHQQGTMLLETILKTRNSYDAILHRHLLLAANALVDCNTWSINISLQKQVAKQLFVIYGDTYGAGRYTKLQEDIKKTALLWLCGQPSEPKQPQPPLLEAWYSALCDDTNERCQLGAVKLLTAIALDLATCPDIVLHTLIPPLLHLASIQCWYHQELSCPQEIRANLDINVHSSTTLVEEYAIVALRLIDARGPAGWLHDDWLRWGKKQPELLERLTQHSIELDYLLTPAAFPGRKDDVNWNSQLNIRLQKKLNASDLQAAQRQLLQASTTAQYPYAYLFWKMLQCEDEEVNKNRNWKDVWLDFLQEEISKEYCISLQSCCLHLKCLLIGDNREQYEKMATDLAIALTSTNVRQVQINLNTVSSIFQRGLLTELALSIILNKRSMIDWQVELSLPDMRPWPDPLTLIWGPDSPILLDRVYLEYVELMLNAREVIDIGYKFREQKRHYRPFLILPQDAFDISQIINTLLNLLLHPTYPNSSIYFEILFALYNVINDVRNDPSDVLDKKKIIESLQQFRQQRDPIPIEQYQMVVTIEQRIEVSHFNKNYSTTPDERVLYLQGLKKPHHLIVASEAKELLDACTDGRALSINSDNEHEKSVREIAEELLFNNFNLTDEAILVLTEALGNGEEQVCAAASQILKSNSKKLADPLRMNIVNKIVTVLIDDKQSYHLAFFGDIDTGYQAEPLYDLLFETLQALIK